MDVIAVAFDGVTKEYVLALEVAVQDIAAVKVAEMVKPDRAKPPSSPVKPRQDQHGFQGLAEQVRHALSSKNTRTDAVKALKKKREKKSGT